MQNMGFPQSEFLTQIWHSRPFRYTKSERKICEKLSVFNILLDRALDYESRGREFESSRARHLPFWHPQKITRFGLFASSRAYKWSYIMTKVSAPYLYRKRGIYYLQKRIPKPLIPKYGRSIIQRSLRTTDRADAEGFFGKLFNIQFCKRTNQHNFYALWEDVVQSF